MSAATLTTGELQLDTGGLSVADKDRAERGMIPNGDGTWRRPGDANPSNANALVGDDGLTVAQRDRYRAEAARAVIPTLEDKVANLIQSQKSPEQLAAERHVIFEREQEAEVQSRQLEAECLRTREQFVAARDAWLAAAPDFAELTQSMNAAHGAMRQAGYQAFDRARIEVGIPPKSAADLSRDDPELRRVIGILRDRTIA